MRARALLLLLLACMSAVVAKVPHFCVACLETPNSHEQWTVRRESFRRQRRDYRVPTEVPSPDPPRAVAYGTGKGSR